MRVEWQHRGKLIQGTVDKINKNILRLVKKTKGVIDIVYNPIETNFLKKGKELGNMTENGRTMFVYQALEAFKLWHGIEPAINSETLEILNND